MVAPASGVSICRAKAVVVWNNWISLPAFQEGHGALKLVQPSPKWIILWQIVLWGKYISISFYEALQDAAGLECWKMEKAFSRRVWEFLAQDFIKHWDVGAAGREAACPPPCHGATCGSVGTGGHSKYWPWISWAWPARNTQQGLSKL